MGTGTKGKQKANTRRGHIKGWGDVEMGAKGRRIKSLDMNKGFIKARNSEIKSLTTNKRFIKAQITEIKSRRMNEGIIKAQKNPES